MPDPNAPAANAAPAGAPKADKPKGDGQPKSYGATLSGPTKGESLRFLALRRKDNSWTTYGSHIMRDGEGHVKSSTRGATAQHADEAGAKAAIDKAVKAALAAGWTQKRGGGGGGFHAKADAFDLKSLPTPKGLKSGK